MPRRARHGGGVRAAGKDRIGFEFMYEGRRYRPTVLRKPTDANLRRARVQLQLIDEAIRQGTFDFAEEFPDYRLKSRAPSKTQQAAAPHRAPVTADGPRRTFGDVMDHFLAYCETRVAMNDMAYSSLSSYREILKAIWRPQLGEEIFEDISYSRLLDIASKYARRMEHIPGSAKPKRPGTPVSKKRYNNVVSAIRVVFEHGYNDLPEKHNPALRLKTLRITKKDSRPADPFTIQEGETIIAGSHAEFGSAHGNYEEFRFFTALRPSEQIALKVNDCDVERGKVQITRACVHQHDRNRTKTNEDREIELCGRALDVLKRQLTLRESLVQSGSIKHEFVFFKENGQRLVNLSYPYQRWRHVLESSGVRYREPYNARHSFISWSLMINKNILKLAQEGGHSVQTMLNTYAAWTKGATHLDVERIKQAMEHSPEPPAWSGATATAPTSSSTERHWGRLSWRRRKHLNNQNAVPSGTLSKT